MKNKQDLTKPEVICHLLCSLDGKIDGGFFESPEIKPYLSAYGQIRSEFDYQAILNGTITCSEIYADGYLKKAPESSEQIPRQDWLSKIEPDKKMALCLDPLGQLNFKQNRIRKGEETFQLVSILTESVQDGYLAFLRRKEIPYLFAGKDDLDIPLLLDKLSRDLGIETLLITGGGILDWSFLQAGYIDMLSVVQVPLVSAETKAASLFDRSRWADRNLTVPFYLNSVERIEPDGLWLVYEPKNTKG